MENFSQIEQWMLSKSFEELSDNEREIISESYSKKEYGQMRELLLSSKIYRDSTSINPRLEEKEKLMLMFDQKNTKLVKPWSKRLSEFLFPSEKGLFLKPGLQMAFASIAIIIGVWVVGNLNSDFSQHENLAKLEDKHEVKIDKPVIEKELGEKESLLNDEEVEESSIEISSEDKAMQPLATGALIGADSLMKSDFEKPYLIRDEMVSFAKAAPPSSDDDMMAGITRSELLKDRKSDEEPMDEFNPEPVTEVRNTTFKITEEPDLLDLLTAVY